MTVFHVMVKTFSMEKKPWYQCSPSHPECDTSDLIRVCVQYVRGRGGCNSSAKPQFMPYFGF